MDPENNQIVYTVKPTEPTDSRVQYYYQIILGATPQKFLTGQGSCDALKSYYLSVNQKVDFEIRYDSASSACKFYGGEKNYNGNIGSIVIKKSNPQYDPNREPEKQTIPLEVVAEQVISNADSGSLDAQVATNIAVNNILNDVEQAEPVVQDLENNARDKDPRCKAIVGEMERLATDVEFRYNDLLLDRHDLYKNYRSIKNAHWRYGSWDGHIKQYNIVQGKLKGLVTKAVIEGCTVSPYVRKWSEQKPPAQPLPKG